MASLIISEKPSTAQKIAEALSGKPSKKTYLRKVPYYELKYKRENILVAPAVGHLFILAEKSKKGWTYPVFDLEWKPIYEAGKTAQFAKPYLDAIKFLAKSADKFIIATDYDIEGETIGYNILRFACNTKTAERMKFSTTTKEGLLNAFLSKSPSIDYPQAYAGITRHELDYYWGINLSRALTLSLKNSAQRFKILSIGRVQGPALNLIVAREREISSFKPIPYWEIELLAKEVSAWHSKGKFFKKKDAERIVGKCKGKKAIVSKIERSEYLQPAPNPFDLTALQIEAYKQFKIQPKDTLSIAQNLYVNSYISYPRTSSNNLPPSIDYKKIITKLSSAQQYKSICKSILALPKLQPNNGKKTDPAHPAIYFTGEIPASLGKHEQNIYDLIVHRTLASFAPPARIETAKITISIQDEGFLAQGSHTIDKGWHTIYGKYLAYKETQIPNLRESQQLTVKELKLHSKHTEPPKRYTSASIIKALESKGLGTKATRSEIVDNLFKRSYAHLNSSISVTSLGMKTLDTLAKFCPEVTDEALTRHFEEEISLIQFENKPADEVLSEAKQTLIRILAKFKHNEQEIGKALGLAVLETIRQESLVGKCPLCKEDLKIIFSKKTKSSFIACSGYPNCKQTYGLPKGYLAKPANKLCERCSSPTVFLIRKARRPWQFCINPDCPLRVEWRNKKQKKA